MHVAYSHTEHFTLARLELQHANWEIYFRINIGGRVSYQ